MAKETSYKEPSIQENEDDLTVDKKESLEIGEDSKSKQPAVLFEEEEQDPETKKVAEMNEQPMDLRKEKSQETIQKSIEEISGNAEQKQSSTGMHIVNVDSEQQLGTSQENLNDEVPNILNIEAQPNKEVQKSSLVDDVPASPIQNKIPQQRDKFEKSEEVQKEKSAEKSERRSDQRSGQQMNFIKYEEEVPPPANASYDQQISIPSADIQSKDKSNKIYTDRPDDLVRGGQDLIVNDQQPPPRSNSQLFEVNNDQLEAMDQKPLETGGPVANQPMFANDATFEEEMTNQPLGT